MELAFTALYSVSFTIWPQPASCIDFARARFLTMFLIRRSSKAMKPCSLTSIVESLWLKSRRWRLTRECREATLRLALSLLLEPFFL